MKGRNPFLISLRNEYLIKRYYYWHELQRLRRDDTLEMLSKKEIFLEKFTIECILRDNHLLIKEIKRKKPPERQLDSFVFEGMLPQPARGTLIN